MDNLTKMINKINNARRIEELITEVNKLNNLDEYNRLKHYSLIAYDLRLLNYYIKGGE